MEWYNTRLAEYLLVIFTENIYMNAQIYQLQTARGEKTSFSAALYYYTDTHSNKEKNQTYLSTLENNYSSRLIHSHL